MILPEIRPIDLSQPMQNFLVARRQRGLDEVAKSQGIMDKKKFENEQVKFRNSLADRDQELIDKTKDREYKAWQQKAAKDEIWQKRGQELLATIDPDEKDDNKYNSQVSAVADQMGARLNELGAPPEYIQKMVQDVLENGGFSRDYIRGVKKKLGIYVEPKKPTTEAIQVGDQNVTYEVDQNGNRKEIARGPKWDEKNGGTEASLKAAAWGRIYANKALPADLAITGLDRDPALAQAAKMVSDDLSLFDLPYEEKLAKTKEIAEQIRGNYGKQFMAPETTQPQSAPKYSATGPGGIKIFSDDGETWKDERGNVYK